MLTTDSSWLLVYCLTSTIRSWVQCFLDTSHRAHPPLTPPWLGAILQRFVFVSNGLGVPDRCITWPVILVVKGHSTCGGGGGGCSGLAPAQLPVCADGPPPGTSSTTTATIATTTTTTTGRGGKGGETAAMKPQAVTCRAKFSRAAHSRDHFLFAAQCTP
jgi:hypothetical protein